MERYYQFESQFGNLTMASENGSLTKLYMGGYIPENAKIEKTEEAAEASRQLAEYFNKKRTFFDLPLNPAGTEFQRKVWKELCNIPYGETRTYKEIAMNIGSKNTCRAVGMANHNNPIMIIIPCHRVVGADGSLTGYGGGLPVKEKLLALEGVQIFNEKIRRI